MPEESGKAKLSDNFMATAHLQQRRERRFAVAIEIEATGIDRNGQVFHERTITKDVSEWGCGFLLHVELRQDDMLQLRATIQGAGGSTQTHQRLFQVRRVMREGDAWLVGAWKMDEGSMWGVELEKTAAPDLAELESRKQQSSVDDATSVKDKGR
jgi:hypothetical protein